MRKGAIIAGAAVAIAAAGGFFGLQWAQSRAVAEVDRTFAALRATGATIEHKQPTFDIWSRSVRIDDIRIGLPGETAKSITISNVLADGLSLFSNDFEAARFEIFGIEVNRTTPGNPSWSFALKVPSIKVSALTLPKSPASAPDQVTAAGTYLQQIRVGSIVADTLDATANVPMLQQPPARAGQPRKPDVPLRYTYSDLKFDRIADGRIASFVLGKASFDGPTGSGTVAGSTIEDIDLLPFFRVGLEKRKPDDGYYRVQGKQTVGPMTMKLPDGGEFVIESMTASSFGIDPTKVSIQSIIELMTTLSAAGPNPTPVQLTSFMTGVGKLYEGLRMDDLAMTGMHTRIPSAAPGSNFRIGNIALTGLIRGKLKRLQVDDVVMASPAARPGMRPGAPEQIRLGMFSLNGFDISGIMRLAGSISQPGRPGQQPPAIGQMIGLLEGFEVRGFDVPDFGSGAVTIEDMKVSWGEPVGSGLPAVIATRFKGIVPINPRDPNMRQLTQKGIKSVAVDSELASTYQTKTFELTLSPLRMSIEHFGAWSGSVVVGSVTPSIYEMLPVQFNMVAPQLTLKSLDLKLEDRGVITNFYLPSIATSPSGVVPPSPIEELKKELLDPAQPGGNLGAILDTFGRFLAEPRQTLTLKLAANSAVRFTDLMGAATPAAPGALARVLEKFAVDVRVSK